MERNRGKLLVRMATIATQVNLFVTFLWIKNISPNEIKVLGLACFPGRVSLWKFSTPYNSCNTIYSFIATGGDS